MNDGRMNETMDSYKDLTYTYLYVNKTLHVMKATENDTGLYRCHVVDHSQRENVAEEDVIVYVTPPDTNISFEKEYEEVTANKNEKVELTAYYKVFPPTPDIQTKWSKDGQPLISNFTHIARHTDSFFSLEISNLNGNDSGLYTVTAHASGHISRRSFLLQVRDVPFVNISLSHSCCYYPGLKYNLSCEIKSYPSPSISWSWKPLCFRNNHQCNSSNETGTWQIFKKYYEVNNSTVKILRKNRTYVSYLSVVAEESGFYKCIAENAIGTTVGEKLFVVTDAENGFEVIYKTQYSNEYTDFVALCKASPVLYSHLRWKWISGATNESQIISSSETDFSKTVPSLQAKLKDIPKKDAGNYVCEATRRNSLKSEEKVLLDILDPLKTGQVSSEMKLNLLLIPFLVGIIVLILIFVIVRKIKISKKGKGNLQDFNQHILEGKMSLFDSNLPLDEQVDLLPYDETWEFPREKLKLGRTLGQGAFGRVVKAEAFEINEDGTSTTVAVKMLKERTDQNQQKSLMDELKILIHLGHHVNIVNLMGAVTKNIQRDGLMVIVEYCLYGNIRHYLQRHRDKFINEIDKQSGKIVSDGDFLFSDYEISHDSNCQLVRNSSSSSSGVFSVHNPNYSNQTRGKNVVCCNPRGSDCSHMQYLGSTSTSSGSMFQSYSRSESQETVTTTSDLLCFAFQCARGMDYLASRKLIHRDLAARNVLLAEGKIVKICDFGLAKDCYKYSNYIKKGDGPLPIKWMSIESIWDHVFTTKSDVWSFGILMWEIFTLGGNPYPGLDINEYFYKKLKSGYRMERPELCPAFAYQIMKDCWNADPDKRPHFCQIADMLGNSLEENVKQHYIDVNEPYMEMNRKMKSPFYSNVGRLEWEESTRPYVNSKVQDITSNYDIPKIRLESDNSLPCEPMEIVPMIQLESHPEAADDVSNKEETTELHSNVHFLSDLCHVD